MCNNWCQNAAAPARQPRGARRAGSAPLGRRLAVALLAGVMLVDRWLGGVAHLIALMSAPALVLCVKIRMAGRPVQMWTGVIWLASARQQAGSQLWIFGLVVAAILA